MDKGSERITQALRLVHAGRVFDLSVELGRPAPGKTENGLVSITTDIVSDPSRSGRAFRSERIAGPLHHGTHVDMLDHFSPSIVSDDTAGDSGSEAAGFTGPAVCRGVLIDIAGYLGHPLADGFMIGTDLLGEAITAQGIRVRAGDAVLIRTGKADSFANDPEGAWLACPGISVGCAQVLARCGMSIFGIDAASPDPLPIADWRETVHEELLVKRKIHIVENLYLKELAQSGASEFLFICNPLRIHNATGAWARPIAVI